MRSPDISGVCFIRNENLFINLLLRLDLCRPLSTSLCISGVVALRVPSARRFLVGHPPHNIHQMPLVFWTWVNTLLQRKVSILHEEESKASSVCTLDPLADSPMNTYVLNCMVKPRNTGENAIPAHVAAADSRLHYTSISPSSLQAPDIPAFAAPTAKPQVAILQRQSA